MKDLLKFVSLCLAIGAVAQTVTSYGEDFDFLDFVDARNGSYVIDTGYSQIMPVVDENGNLIIQNIIHYTESVQWQEDFLSQLQGQIFLNLDFSKILGRGGRGGGSPGT